MANTSYGVTVQIDGQDIPCGTLWQSVRHGSETTSFSYNQDYLMDGRAFSLSPDMPLGPGMFHSQGLRGLRAFEDAMPDRWGRNLLMRSERLAARNEGRTERTLFETDFLVGVSDETRQGALRLWNTNGTALAQSETGVPREVSIPSLLDASDRAAHDMDADVRDLVAAGSSLGGARPKASVRTADGRLCVAKFPKADEEPLAETEGWERVMLVLMAKCGITVPDSRLLRLSGRTVLLTGRFDRRGGQRIPYISGLTAIQGNDGGTYSYLELVDFIEAEGADPLLDLSQLWQRALFSCVVGNTDNHLRNYGFLREAGGWRLAPALDVNPTTGGGEKYLATTLDFDNAEASPRLALDVADCFRVGRDEAVAAGRRMLSVVQSWRKVARSEGIPEAAQAVMAGNLERGLSALEKAVR